jgi:hypothetical protein
VPPQILLDAGEQLRGGGPCPAQSLADLVSFLRRDLGLDRAAGLQGGKQEADVLGQLPGSLGALEALQ